MHPMLEEFHFGPEGLMPAIIQDVSDGTVLMLAYMNREALERTLQTGQTHFWSRSRQTLWKKGETSGDVQQVITVHYDCDRVALLVQVRQQNTSSHTGQRSCFSRTLPLSDASIAAVEADTLPLPALPEVLSVLDQLIFTRRQKLSTRWLISGSMRSYCLAIIRFIRTKS